MLPTREDVMHLRAVAVRRTTTVGDVPSFRACGECRDLADRHVHARKTVSRRVPAFKRMLVSRRGVKRRLPTSSLFNHHLFMADLAFRDDAIRDSCRQSTPSFSTRRSTTIRSQPIFRSNVVVGATARSEPRRARLGSRACRRCASWIALTSGSNVQYAIYGLRSATRDSRWIAQPSSASSDGETCSRRSIHSRTVRATRPCARDQCSRDPSLICSLPA